MENIEIIVLVDSVVKWKSVSLRDDAPVRDRPVTVVV